MTGNQGYATLGLWNLARRSPPPPGLTDVAGEITVSQGKAKSVLDLAYTAGMYTSPAIVASAVCLNPKLDLQ